MLHDLVNIFAGASVLQLSALIGAALFFLITGLKDLQDEQVEGGLYLALGVFFLMAHIFYLVNLPVDSVHYGNIYNLNLWSWLAVLLAPAIIALFLLRALLGFARNHGREGLFKMFFGLTLVCYLYMIGEGWPADVKGILTIVWLMFLFKLELGVATN